MPGLIFHTFSFHSLQHTQIHPNTQLLGQTDKQPHMSVPLSVHVPPWAPLWAGRQRKPSMVTGNQTLRCVWKTHARLRNYQLAYLRSTFKLEGDSSVAQAHYMLSYQLSMQRTLSLCYLGYIQSSDPAMWQDGWLFSLPGSICFNFIHRVVHQSWKILLYLILSLRLNYKNTAVFVFSLNWLSSLKTHRCWELAELACNVFWHYVT